jgi:hypothetical protein
MLQEPSSSQLLTWAREWISDHGVGCGELWDSIQFEFQLVVHKHAAEGKYLLTVTTTFRGCTHDTSCCWKLQLKSETIYRVRMDSCVGNLFTRLLQNFGTTVMLSTRESCSINLNMYPFTVASRPV